MEVLVVDKVEISEIEMELIKKFNAADKNIQNAIYKLLEIDNSNSEMHKNI